MHDTVDLRSDTVTRPSPAMREAMAAAEVGDDVFGEDPTVNALQRRAAELTGKEAALFVPTGTMANIVAILAQTRPGDAVILSEDAHCLHLESGGLAMVAGVLPRPLPGQNGVFTAAQIEPCIISGADHHCAPTTLVTIENTCNRGGGAIYPIGTVRAIGDLARERRLRFHIDGARIFNAAVETGTPAAEYAACATSISFCLSKGLGAPAGSLLAADAATIDRAHRFRKVLGGGMRQAGILAAAGLYALEHNIERLCEDHRRARAFRSALGGAAGIEFSMPSPTNMVYLAVADAPGLARRLAEQGVLVLATGPRRIRVVFHLDIDDAKLDRAVETFKTCL